jgi:hypothetical protein
MLRARRREGLKVCRAGWLMGVSIREYQGLEAGERVPDFDTWERICKLYGWPRSFLGGARPGQIPPVGGEDVGSGRPFEGSLWWLRP